MRRKLLPQQADVLFSEAKNTLAVAGIRGGKTEIGALRTILRAMRVPTAADQCHAVTSPTFQMSKIGPEAKLFKLLEDRSLFPASPLVRFAKSERVFYISTSSGSTSRVRIFSGENPQRWRGDSWLSAWLDEAALLSLEAWNVALGRLAETDGPATFTTTPDGHNFVYDIASEATVDLPVDAGQYRRAGYLARESPNGRTRLVSWSSTANVFLPSSDGFADLVSRYDPDTYAQEVEGQFIARSGRVYRFVRDVHMTKCELNPQAPVYVGQDFNVARMVSVFIQEGPDGVLRVIGEMETRDADTHGLCRKLEGWGRSRGLPQERLIICPDASSRARKTAAASDTGKSDLEILLRAGYRVEGPRANPPIKDRVNCVNGLLHNRKLLVDPSCSLLVEALEKQPWDDRGHEPVKDGILDNRADALGYACWARAPLKASRAVLGSTFDRRAA